MENIRDLRFSARQDFKVDIIFRIVSPSSNSEKARRGDSDGCQRVVAKADFLSKTRVCLVRVITVHLE